ncbi:MAG: pyruvate ferredoxin oxidoreductase, partial [Proteobacteria bacterium]|nr:pyruvate ferredoxin oxidoreductase [Pseudomonadota bacterium]
NPVIFPWQRRDAEGVLRDGYMDMRWKLQHALEGAADVIVRTSRDYAALFGRDHGGMLWNYRTDDAELLIAAMGSIATEATTAADLLREQGIRAGVIGIRVYRPFPREEVRNAFRTIPAIIVFEKDISYGYEGALSADIKAALYGTGIDAPIHNFIAGLGGRDVKAHELADAVRAALAAIAAGNRERQTWLNCVTE